MPVRLSAGCIRLDSQIEAAALRSKCCRAFFTRVILGHVEPDHSGHLPSVEWFRRLKTLDPKRNWRRDIKAALDAGFAVEIRVKREPGDRRPTRYINLVSIVEVAKLMGVQEVGIPREVSIEELLTSLPKAKQGARMRYIATQSTYQQKKRLSKSINRGRKKELRERTDKSQERLSKEIGCSPKTIYRNAKDNGVKRIANWDFVAAEEGSGRVLTFKSAEDAIAYAKGMNWHETGSSGSMLYRALSTDMLPDDIRFRFSPGQWVILRRMTSTFAIEPSGWAFYRYAVRLRNKLGLSRGSAHKGELQDGDREPRRLFYETESGTYYIRDTARPRWNQRS